MRLDAVSRYLLVSRAIRVFLCSAARAYFNIVANHRTYYRNSVSGQTDRQTHTQTDTLTHTHTHTHARTHARTHAHTYARQGIEVVILSEVYYGNPHYACAPRVNNNTLIYCRPRIRHITLFRTQITFTPNNAPYFIPG